MERVHLLSPGDVIFNYAEEYFSNGLKPPIVHAWYHQYQTVPWIFFGFHFFSIFHFDSNHATFHLWNSQSLTWNPLETIIFLGSECTSIRWNATRQECGHRLERSGRSKSPTRFLPRVLRKVWLAGGFFFFPPLQRKWSNLTNIFQMGWNHQLVGDLGDSRKSNSRKPFVNKRHDDLEKTCFRYTSGYLNLLGGGFQVFIEFSSELSGKMTSFIFHFQLVLLCLVW